MNQQAMMKLRKLQKEMADAQKKLESSVFVGSAGGVVSIEMLGDHSVKKVTIDPEAIESKEDVEMLEDTLVAAFNDCLKKIEAETEKVMGPFSAGLPGGLF